MTQNLTLRISGMHCGNCVAKVARALTSTEGVEVESLEIGTARVRLDESRTSGNDVAAAVTRAGYPAEVLAAGE